MPEPTATPAAYKRGDRVRLTVGDVRVEGVVVTAYAMPGLGVAPAMREVQSLHIELPDRRIVRGVDPSRVELVRRADPTWRRSVPDAPPPPVNVPVLAREILTKQRRAANGITDAEAWALARAFENATVSLLAVVETDRTPANPDPDLPTPRACAELFLNAYRIPFEEPSNDPEEHEDEPLEDQERRDSGAPEPGGSQRPDPDAG